MWKGNERSEKRKDGRKGMRRDGCLRIVGNGTELRDTCSSGCFGRVREDMGMVKWGKRRGIGDYMEEERRNMTRHDYKKGIGKREMQIAATKV